MASITTLMNYSDYQPSGRGMVSSLYAQLVNGVTIENAYQALGINGSYGSTVLSDLKKELITGLYTGFKKRSASERHRIELFKKYAVCKSLWYIDDRPAWILVVKDTLTKAAKFGELEIAHDLSKDLVYYYSIVNIQTDNYKKYTEKEAYFRELIKQSDLAYRTYADLVFRIRKRRELSNFPALIKELENFAKDNEQYSFNIRYYKILVTWYQANNDWVNLVTSCENAIHFIDNYKGPLPPTGSFLFHLAMLPTLIRKSQYGKAESVVSRSEKIAVNGGHNWHTIQIYRALIGFHSQKLYIALSAYQIAQKYKKSTANTEQWQIIKAYLVYFQNRGLLKTNIKFRLGTFLNSVPDAEQQKENQNISILIVKCLHFLQQNRKIDYMNTVEYFEQYIQKFLRGKEHIRHRALLRCLRNVEMADYHLVRWEAMSKKHLQAIEKNPIPVSIKFMESEVLPCELVIEEIKHIIQ